MITGIGKRLQMMKKEARAKSFLNYINGSKLKNDPNFEFREVKTLDELKAASHVAYKAYHGIKLLSKNPHEMKFMPQQATRHSRTFAVFYKGRVLSTATLVQDSPVGLPSHMEKNRPALLKRLRQAGRQIGVITMLATDPDWSNENNLPLSQRDRAYLLTHMFKAMWDFNRIHRFSDGWLICVLENHDFFYEVLHFDLLSPAEPYQWEEHIFDKRKMRFLDINYQIKTGAAPSFRQFFEIDKPISELSRQAQADGYLHLKLEEKKYILSRLPKTSPIQPGSDGVPIKAA